MYRITHQRTLFIYLFGMLFLFILAVFNIFYHLGVFPIYSWDEARHGVSAFEMIQNHNYIVNTYRFKNDYWNLKPPLSFWAIILGYKLVGFNALGLRLCSAIFSILTILCVAGFVYKRYGKKASFISMLVLSTCTQFLINHSSRTGDADALFIFLFTIAILALLHFNQNSKWWIYVTGISFALAFLTKSWHAGNIVVIVGIYLFTTGKFRFLSVREWIIFVLCMVLPITLWAIFRYQYDGTTFFKNMINYDLLHRSSTTIEGHVGGVFYYVSILSRFFLYWIFILIGLLAVSYKKIIAVKSNTLFGVLLWILVPFILFTIAKTKVRWYILPIYPPLSILIGVLGSKLLHKGRTITRVILLASIFFAAFSYESQIIGYLKHPPVNSKQDLIEMAQNNRQIKNDSLYIYHTGGLATWLQSEALTAELSDDLRVKNGGIKEFLNKQRDLLMIPKKWFTNEFVSKNHLKVIASNQWGYLVGKNS